MKIDKLEHWALVLLFSVISAGVQAQLFMTKEDVMDGLASNGFTYELGITDQGMEFLYYEREMETEASGQYIQAKAMYFVGGDNEPKICGMWKVSQPLSEKNGIISFFRNEGFVEVNPSRWKNPENNVIYVIEIENGLCLVVAYPNVVPDVSEF